MSSAGDEASAAINRDDLSLYTAPQQKFPYVESETGRLESGVAALRQTAEPFSAWCQAAYGAWTPRVRGVARVGTELRAFLDDAPENFYPRAGIIAFAGVAGLLLARGSRVKRAIYPVGLMAVGAAAYYPERAVAIVKSSGDSLYELALGGYVALDKMLRPASKPGKDTDSDP